MDQWFWKRINIKKNYKNSKDQGPFIIINGALLDSRKYELELFGEEEMMVQLFMEHLKGIESLIN